MEQSANQSEVAQLLDRIEAEYLAATQGLTGLAATARHAIIAARTERMGQLHKDLRAVVGDDAIRLIAERLDSL